MFFYSTSGKEKRVPLQRAVFRGLAEEGGLYMPESLPHLSQRFLNALRSVSFQEICFEIGKQFLSPAVPDPDIRRIIADSINFDSPLVQMEEDLHCLELFHGPTLAFKDFGARFMARLMSYLREGSRSQLTVLVATSGDTGSAVAHGFYRLPGIRVVLLYPSGKVSEIQEKQLTTLGENVIALEIQGTFDDCQKMVKQAFQDSAITQNMELTSANSINIARLIPQSFYYFRAVGQLKQTSKKIVVSVPSGNFGNLTAGLFAKKMGLPVSHFIAATNINDVIPKYLESGLFQPCPSIQTLSNAMDVGNPSNFVRILALYENDFQAIKSSITGISFSDAETREKIGEVYRKYSYFLEPHGAIGYAGLTANLKEDETGIFLETAHPAKFPEVVEQVTGARVAVPEALKECMTRPKKSILLSNQFEDLKSFLMDL